MSNPSHGFRVALHSEMPNKWQKCFEITEQTALLLKCNVDDIGSAVTFSAPQCPLSMAYQAWLCTQKVHNAVGISIENKEVWLEAYGPEGLIEFERSMRADRRPSFEHLVRVHYIKSNQK